MMRAVTLIALVASGCAAAAPRRAAPAVQQRWLKDWALARCLTKGYGLRTPAGEDAATAAAALLEKGAYGMGTYEALEKLVDQQLAKPYSGSTGGAYTTLKCIDLSRSRELDALVSRPKATPVER